VKIPPLLALLFQDNGFLFRGRGMATTHITCRPWNMSCSNTLTQVALSHLYCSSPPTASSPALAGWAGSRRGATRDRAPPWAPVRMGAYGLVLLFIFAPLLHQKRPR
jgi:hypothetical protein